MLKKVDPETYRRRSLKALIGFAFVVGLFFYAFRMVRVQGVSMQPTFRNGQWLLVRRNNWPSPPLRVGDIVVFRMEDDILVKRIAAVGGQMAPQPRAMVVYRPSHKRPGWWEAAVIPEAPRRIPPGQVYVLGDNAPHSDDSRNFGPVPVSALLGRVLRWKDPGPPAANRRQAAR